MSFRFPSSPRSPRLPRLPEFPLIKAIKSKNIKLIEELIEEGDLNERDNYGKTPLFYAIETKDKSIVELLLEKGAYINAKTNAGRTSIFYAVETGDKSIVELLLEKGAYINAKTDAGQTPLILAVFKNNIDMIKLLLERGANPFIEPSASCRSYDCRRLISEYVWKALSQTDRKLAEQFSKSGDIRLPVDVWELILLNKRQQQLCQNLSTEKNSEVLRFFALSMDIPVTYDMTKAQLCGIISRQLAYGKYYNEKAKNFTEKRIKEDRRKIKQVAQRFGLDINKPVSELLNDLAKLMT